MKALELTEIQTLRLNEMCQFYYPEYNVQTITKNDHGEFNRRHIEYNFGFIILPRIEWADQTDYIYSVKIPWFEFCMTHLAFKIINGFTFNSLYYNALAYTTKTNSTALNPVDFLYAEFKRK